MPSVRLEVPELANHAAITLQLPTYVPWGINNRFIRDDIVPASGGASGLETHVFLLRNDDADPSTPAITIYQSRPRTSPPAACDQENCQTTDIDGTTVTCRLLYPGPDVPLYQPPVTPMPSDLTPILRCEWQTSAWWFQMDFNWALTETTPEGVPADYRADAMRVITSLIENPFSIAGCYAQPCP